MPKAHRVHAIGHGIRRATWIAALVASLGGCAATSLRPAATDLAGAGKRTMDVAAAYYAALDGAVRSELEQEFLAQAFSDITNNCRKAMPPLVPSSEACAAASRGSEAALRTQTAGRVALYSQILAATAARRRMVTQIASLYEAYGNVAEKDLGATFASHGQDIGNAIGSMRGTPLKDAQNAVLGGLLTRLGSAIQDKELRRGSAALAPVVAAFREYFSIERPAWDTFSDQAMQLRQQNTVYAVQLQFGSTGDVASQLIGALGLQPTDLTLNMNPSSFQAVVLGVVLRNGVDDEAQQAVGAATEKALGALELAHSQFGAPAQGAAAVEQFASEASTYLDLIAKLRKEPTGGK